MENLTTRERHSLNAMKMAYASLLLNKVKLPVSESMLKSAILEYGEEHLADATRGAIMQEDQSKVLHFALNSIFP